MLQHGALEGSSPFSRVPSCLQFVSSPSILQIYLLFLGNTEILEETQDTLAINNS